MAKVRQYARNKLWKQYDEYARSNMHVDNIHETYRGNNMKSFLQ